MLTSITWDGSRVAVDPTSPGSSTVHVRAQGGNVEFSADGINFFATPTSSSTGFDPADDISLTGATPIATSAITSLDLNGATLPQSAFSGANLSNATSIDLGGATIGANAFDSANLSAAHAINLQDVVSLPSSAFLNTSFAGNICPTLVLYSGVALPNGPANNIVLSVQNIAMGATFLVHSTIETSLNAFIFCSSRTTIANTSNGFVDDIRQSGSELIIQDRNNTADALSVERDNSDILIHDPNNTLVTNIGAATGSNSNTVRVPSSGIDQITIKTADAADSLTIDLSGGNFTSIPIRYHGGDPTSGSGDSLTLEGGGTFADATFNFIDASSGTIQLSGNSTITYQGLEPVTSSINATNVALNYSDAAETIHVQNKPPGALDTSFDSDGKVTTAFMGAAAARDIAFQADGKLVVAGKSGSSFALARYDINGSLDASFSGDGLVTTPTGGPGGINGLAIQSDGKIIAAGRGFEMGDPRFMVARYHVNGDLDTSFGVGGIVLTDFSHGTNINFPATDDEATDVAIQDDGKIVVVGVAAQDFAVVRYDTNGTLDNSFDSDGKTATDFGGNPTIDRAVSVGIQSSGKIVVGGTTGFNNIGAPGNFALARYNPNGSLDATFAGSGRVQTDVNGADELNELVIRDDDTIVAAGTSGFSLQVSGDFALAQYDSNGGPIDSNGALPGVVRQTNISGESDIARSLAIQDDGKIVLAGLSDNNFGEQDFTLARYHSDGTPDADFGNNGTLTTPFNSSDADIANRVKVQSDGKIVVAGKTHLSQSTTHFAVARYESVAKTVVTSTAGEAITFNNPTGTLTINGGNVGADIINIDGLAKYPANVVIDGQSGSDTININGVISLQGNKQFTASAENLVAAAAGQIRSVTGDISLIVDTIDLDGASEVASAGNLTIRPQSAGRAINLGAGAVNAGMQLTDGEINQLQDGFASITIGDATTGAVSVKPSIFNDPLEIRGSSIELDGLNAGTNNVRLIAASITSPAGTSVSDVVGNVFFDGNLSPGASPGRLVVDGNVANVFFGDSDKFTIDLDGSAPGTEHDQLRIKGGNRTVTLGDVTLETNFNYMPAAADELVIIDNVDTGSSVIGTFDGMPDGHELLFGTLQSGQTGFFIDYDGGTGDNDVVLDFNDKPAVAATAGNDDLFAIVDGVNVQVFTGGRDGTLIFNRPQANLTDLTINGLAGNDTLTIDFSGGNFVVPIVFNGGDPTSGSGDTLTLQGGGLFPTAIYEFDNPTDGSVDITGNGTITYTGLEPINSTISATDVSLNYSEAVETINVNESAGIAAATEVTSTAGEIIRFNNPTGTLTINAGDTGGDTINLNSLTASYAASINVNGQGGKDTLNVNGTISLAANRNLSFAADNILINNANSLSLHGTGALLLDAEDQLFAGNGTKFSVVDGNAAIKGNQGGSAPGNLAGVLLLGATVETTGTGDILLTGQGQDQAGTDTHVGVVVFNGMVRSTKMAPDAGAITIIGTGGDGANNNNGVDINNSQVESAFGDITITGTGGSGSGADNRGVFLLGGSQVASNGTGMDAAKITIQGTGGTGTDRQHGVQISANSLVTSVDGDIEITGQAGNGSGNTNVGVQLDNNGQVTSTGTGVGAANINVQGTGNGQVGTLFNHGVSLEFGSTIAVHAGDATVTGVGGGASGLGVFLVGNTGGDSIKSNGAGSITVEGTGVSIPGIVMQGANSFIGGPSSTGDVMLITDTIDLVAGSVRSAGALTIKPKTATISIGIGGGAGTLNLSDAEIGLLQDGFSAVNIGDATLGTGTVDIDTATFLDPVTIAGGLIKDHANVDITAPSTTLKGNVSPGQSPGVLNVSAVLALADDATLSVELGGASAGVGTGFHDQVAASGNVTIGSEVGINVQLIDGFLPSYGDQFEIATWTGTRSGEFAFSGITIDNNGNPMVLVPVYQSNALKLTTTGLGDANLDGKTDFVDFQILQNGYQKTGTWASGDFDLNGDVDFLDFQILQNHFNDVFFVPPIVALPVAARDVGASVGRIWVKPKLKRASLLVQKKSWRQAALDPVRLAEPMEVRDAIFAADFELDKADASDDWIIDESII